MSNAASQLLRSFKALSPSEQHDVLVQLLREPIEAEYQAPSDDELVALAEEVFLEYDKSENPT
jgi:hypothetical protein